LQALGNYLQEALGVALNAAVAIKGQLHTNHLNFDLERTGASAQAFCTSAPSMVGAANFMRYRFVRDEHGALAAMEDAFPVCPRHLLPEEI
jgi:hypothetical protein